LIADSLGANSLPPGESFTTIPSVGFGEFSVGYRLRPHLFRKRPFLARGLWLGVHWLPIPGQELVEAIGGMTVMRCRTSLS
jgi:hypothetical protein